MEYNHYIIQRVFEMKEEEANAQVYTKLFSGSTPFHPTKN